MDRRSFLTMAGAAVASAAAPRTKSPQTASQKPRFRTGLVAYSYRQALQSKAMSYEDLIDIAVFKMFAAYGYRGYMGLEYGGSADPQTTIPTQLRRLKEMAQKYSA